MKIFFGDLVHTWEKVSLWTFPLNVGYVGAYARKELAGRADVELRIFKRPELMIQAIRQENPDIVGLSHYVWNANLNRLVFQLAKRCDPGILTVGGGPNFTSANADEAHARAFFAASPDCDAYVVNQGELGFAEVAGAFHQCGGDVRAFRARPVAGALVNDGNGGVHLGEALDIIRDLDEIPSPYLTGLMDPFFDEPFVPILETNRSCPYRCTFCAWGIGTGKLARFSEGRVMDEIEYFSRRCTKSANMFIADANFSVLERDAAFARRLRRCRDKHGYPGHVSIQWNKTRPDRVLRVARELGGMAEVGASMQSLDPRVLAAIKRRNLTLDDVAGMTETLRAEGNDIPLFSELIVGLPLETRHGHIAANRKLVDLGAEIFNYNLHLLPGTEMDSALSRREFFHKTAWRLHDNAFGIYDGVTVFEGQEVVTATSTMSETELRSFRFIHFLIQFMWSRKWYYDFLRLFQQAGIHPVDVVVRIAEAASSDDGEIGALHRRFRADHDLENFATFDGLAEYWSRDENIERLRSGGYGKLNFLYTYEILLEHYEAFNDFLMGTARAMAREANLNDEGVFLDQCREVLDFSRELRVSLTRSLDRVVDNKRISFSYDLLSWRESGYRGKPSRISTSGRYEYEFYLPEQQRSILERQLSQFRSHSVSLTLRKMSEEIGADEFFYKVRPVRSGAPRSNSRNLHR